MRIQVATGLSSLRAEYFMKGQRLQSKDDPMVRFTATSHRSIDDQVHYEHWNRCHVRGQENDNLPSVWTDFHTQEMLRCLIEFLEETPGSGVPSTLVSASGNCPFPSPERLGQLLRLAANMRCRIARDPAKSSQVSRLQKGNKWCRQTEPAYACASGDSEWAVVLDARTTRQIKSDVRHHGPKSGFACTLPACD